ncbi:unnamed protein product [Schistosoma mattheei]|uniref:Uncharacterized protein n=1 Tax=Schistosoma mattheei TaxID=31246 RepID=A0A183P6S1_9TREM|nr:unnamed protein product [Schistosoma mattheei]
MEISKLKLKLKSFGHLGEQHYKSLVQSPFEIPTNNEFNIALSNMSQALQTRIKEGEITMENNWKGIKKSMPGGAGPQGPSA